MDIQLTILELILLNGHSALIVNGRHAVIPSLSLLELILLNGHSTLIVNGHCASKATITLFVLS
jgi:hypothetical protein